MRNNRLDPYGNTICPVCELPIADPLHVPIRRRTTGTPSLLGHASSAQRRRGAAQATIKRDA